MIQNDVSILSHSDSHVFSQMPKPLSNAKVESPLSKETKGDGILKHKTALTIV